jgi:hypothetical protein
MTRIDRCALAVVLILGAAPAFAQSPSLVCQPIQRGESAAQVARRLTGDSRNTYRASFQILNASSRFVPKSQYDRIRAGWRACVIRPAQERVPSVALARKGSSLDRPDAATVAAVSLISPVTPASRDRLDDRRDDRPANSSDVLRALGSSPLSFVWLGAAKVVPWFGWRILDDYLARRKTASVVMGYFADRFISEFERPLLRYDARERPLRSRVRYRMRPRRFEIHLAPGDGRRYPNLSDHRKYVEYDIARVLDLLADRSFVRGPLNAQADWVVVPFHFKAGPKHAGVTCISSF